MYNLQINNRFGNLECDDENEENLENKKVTEIKKENRKDTKKTPKGNATAVPAKAPLPVEKAPRSQPRAPVNAPAAEKPAAPVDNAGRRPPRQFGGNAPAAGFNNRNNEGGPTAFAHSNAGNRQGGGRPMGGFENRGKREFERKSGSEKTGVKASDKRDGAGPHNWGHSIKDFTTETFAPPADADHDAGTEKKPEDKAAEGEGGDAPESQEPQDAPVMSLDEYLNKKKEGKTGMPSLQLRKPGEGEGSFAVGKLGKKIQKSKEDSEEVVVIEKPGGSGRVKTYLEVNFPSMANRGRGGGGGGARRGGGGRGQFREGGHGRDFQGSNQPNIMDESAFPALHQ